MAEERLDAQAPALNGAAPGGLSPECSVLDDTYTAIVLAVASEIADWSDDLWPESQRLAVTLQNTEGYTFQLPLPGRTATVTVRLDAQSLAHAARIAKAMKEANTRLEDVDLPALAAHLETQHGL